MEWLERMNRALEYIEMNLAGEIKLAEVARKACCSSHQFQRMFSFITNVTLAEYIRRRRLTLAALELQNSNDTKVLDIAIKYGYESPISLLELFNYYMASRQQWRVKTEIRSRPTLDFPSLLQLKE